ncbi:hypothetical protein BK004_01955 [bacterium CG10_46_32]|nr:MAG: hypothetical protein BK004_01955 [bacterium CG10_46_32]PIR56199.1 MAG: hypothetical protein COU73_01980 [Parcubacteria group bacterium CG10_big_fil_rev_8_21_14_0_10_46_32]
MEGHSIDIIKPIQHSIIFVAVFFVCALAWVAPAHAATTLAFPNNTFPDGYTLTAANSPYIAQTTTIKVAANTTVTIEPGVVIKMPTGLQFQIFIDGTLIIAGIESAPVVFTSIKDDEYGGDTNSDGNETLPSPGDWFRMSVSGRLDAEYVIIRYGGKSNWPMLLVTGGEVTLNHSVIEQSVWEGIKNITTGSTISIADSVVRDNAQTGFRLQNDAFTTVVDTLFYGNKIGMLAVGGAVVPAHVSIVGSSFYDNSESAVFYSGDDPLDMTNNWWGSSSGPTIASNPSGTGDVIVGNVTYSPWTNQDPANQAPVLSYQDLDGYTADGASPDISFVGQDVPVFRILFTDSDGDSAQYVRLVVGNSAYPMATSSNGLFEFTPNAGVFPKGSYSYHFETSDGLSAVRLPSSGELMFEVRNVPVILVPGIAGTILKQEVFGGLGDITLWPNFLWTAISVAESYMDPLSMNEDGSPSDNSVYVDDIFRKASIFGGTIFDYLDGLINDFESAGYQENTDLFLFPYDWRLNIQSISQFLVDKIDSVIQQTGSQKVDIVAHSMGGLVLKQYILDNSSSRVNKMIFVGTPHLGSPKSAKVLLYGDNLGMGLIMNQLEIKSITKNMASVYQLLPSSLYISEIGKYFYNLAIPKSHTYDEVNNYLVNQGLNFSLVQSADDLHSNALDDFNTTGMDAYNIVGCDTATLGKIIIRNQELVKVEYGVEFVAGDGTVPLDSATAIDIQANKTFYAIGVEHATMPSQSSIKQLITEIITGTLDTSSLPDISQDISQCVFNGQVVSVHSPVNLNVYDANGNHVGPDENGDIELNIPGATYEQIGDNKFIFIPNTDSTSYNIQHDGTGSGTFSLYVSKVVNNQVIETAYYTDVPVNQSTSAQVALSSDVSGTTLQVDTNGTGSFAPVTAAAVLNSTQAGDITKPTTTISVSGGASSAAFELLASDDNSGVLKTEYSLDNGSTWHAYENQVILTTIGDNTVLYRSKDRVGNLEDYHTQTINVYSPAVIIVPTPAAPAGKSQDENTQEPNRHPGLDSGSASTPEVLGVKIERAQSEQYTQDDILAALHDGDIETLLDYLSLERNFFSEQETAQKYGRSLRLNQAGINFITYGTKSTQKLGTGERAGVLYSYKAAFGILPTTSEDWNDVIRIATNQAPIQRSGAAERKAKDVGMNDEKSIITVAYGLRPDKRDLDAERQGIERFIEIYGKLPCSTLDWNILRSFVY